MHSVVQIALLFFIFDIFGKKGEVEVRCLKIPFEVRQVPQDFKEK